MLVVVILGTRLTFFNDDWAYLLQRPGIEGASVFSPHNGQLVVGVDLSVKLLVGLFGYPQLPFRLVLGLSVAGVGIGVYLLVAERVGWVLGLAATAVVILLGTAWEDLLFFASVGPITALAAGLGALYALERGIADGELGRLRSAGRFGLVLGRRSRFRRSRRHRCAPALTARGSVDASGARPAVRDLGAGLGAIDVRPLTGEPRAPAQVHIRVRLDRPCLDHGD